jgi:hypothetical protein
LIKFCKAAWICLRGVLDLEHEGPATFFGEDWVRLHGHVPLVIADSHTLPSTALA